jgi:hypothetical protein
MATSWQSTISDPNERKVFEALSDPRWDFRTIRGISEAVGLLSDQVESILHRYPDLVRRSLVSDEQGNELYTLASRRPGPQEIFSNVSSFITKSSR